MTVAEGAVVAMREAAERIEAMRRQRAKMLAMLERAAETLRETAGYPSAEREQLALDISNLIVAIQIADL